MPQGGRARKLLANWPRAAYRFLMSSRPSAGFRSAAGEKPAKNTREERLAAALRANLKRRKQQARVRASGNAPAKAGEN